MRGLAHLHLRHPINDLAWIEVAENAALEFQQQRRRKISATVEIFRREPAAEKNSHASRVTILLACSSSKMAILKEPSVWQVWLALRLMTAAESSVRDRRDGAEEHRLLARVQRL